MRQPSELFPRCEVLSEEPWSAEAAMLSIAARMCGAIVAPALFCIMNGGVALAEPSVELVQRPGETAQLQAAPTQPPACLPHEGAVDKLRSAYGEKLLGRGISNDATLMEIFLSPSGTFTVIKTTPDGMSCVVDFGEGWQTLNQLESVGLTPHDLKTLKITPQ